MVSNQTVARWPRRHSGCISKVIYSTSSKNVCVCAYVCVTILFFLLLRAFRIPFFFQFYLFIFFTTLYWFCHTLTWIHHGCTCVPHPEPPSHLSPHPIPLGHPSAPAPSILYHASNLDWWFVSHMITYMFNVILPYHPTLTLFHRVQKTVLYICVSFAVSHTGLHYHLSKFHIYALVYCTGVFLSGLLHSV